jgi:hypothetical protein
MPTGTFLPAPVASSSGPKRTGNINKEERKYNPMGSSKRTKASDNDREESGWDAALARFQVRLNELVFNGQPPGGLLPETALAAKTIKSIKEELKRSVSHFVLPRFRPPFH